VKTSARIVSYWLITGLLLIAVTMVTNWLQKNQGQTIDHHASAINLTTGIDIPRGRYYQIKGTYHVDMTGTTRLVLPIKDIPKNPARYDTLVIKGLNSNPHINLYWQWQTLQNPNSAPYQFQLNGYKQSINRLPPDWWSGTDITQLNLIIEVDISLGFVNDYDAEVSWQSIEMLNHSDIAPLQRLSSELHTFVPLNFVSLNLHSSNNELVYRNFLMRLGLWLLLTISLYLVLKPPAIHLLLTLILVWLSASAVYAYNFNQQINSHKVRFSNQGSALNKIDQRLINIASQVNKAIAKDSHDPTAAKVFILGKDQFEKYRLNYYLLNHNAGIINTIDTILKNLGVTNSYTLILPPHLDLCHKSSSIVTSETLKRLILEHDYCLVRL